MKTVSPGKWTGLQRTSTVDDIFSIVAFDQRNSYAKMMPDASFAEAVDLKREVIQQLSPYASAVLLDPEYGLNPATYRQRNCGLLIAAEKSGYSGDSTYRHTELYETWDVNAIKRFGADAVKLLVYYHPDAGDLSREIEDLCSEVGDICQQLDIPFYVEPLAYSLNPHIAKSSPEFARMRPDLIARIVERLGGAGADVFKLEFPIDVAFNDDRAEWERTCQIISEASPIPWALLSAGVDFSIFKEQLEVACKAGASGFIAGRAIWKESTQKSGQERHQFIIGTAIPRLQELVDIATQYAPAWTQKIQMEDIGEGWYKTYGNAGNTS